MKLGLDKCRKAKFIRKKLKYTSSAVLDTGTKINELNQEETCKFNMENWKRKKEKNVTDKDELFCKQRCSTNAKNKLGTIKKISNPCSNIQFQCCQLEFRRNKENREKNSKARCD